MENKDEKIIENEEVETEEIISNEENVTREINLDDLYDGSVNNTIVIDPITNNEVLLSNKKTNVSLILICIAVVILLGLYYVYNKTDFLRETKEVKNVTTKEVIVTTKEDKNGTLTCNYSSKSEAEDQTATFVANYENNKLINANYSFVVISNIENLSAVVLDLQNQYENFYINNSSATISKTTFEKNDKGFTFNIETDYTRNKMDELQIIENQTVLIVKPDINDTVNNLKNSYEEKGFTCTLTNKGAENE